jgi:hypothetical protein
MIVFDLFEQDPNFRKPVEYENRKQFGTVNLANFIKAYQNNQPVQFDFPGGKSYKLTTQWVDMLAEYYNTLETNNDKAQLVYDVLTDYNKTIRLLNELAQSKLFEKKSSKKTDNPEFKSTKLARLKTQARAKYPAAGSDLEAMTADFVDSQEDDQREFQRVKDTNKKQDELLKQITAINQQQDQEIDGLDSDNSNLQKNLQQLRAVNTELAKKLAAMAKRKPKEKEKEKQDGTKTTTSTTPATAGGNWVPPSAADTRPDWTAPALAQPGIPTATPATVGGQPATVLAKPKRKRRTKAEIEADKASKAAMAVMTKAAGGTKIKPVQPDIAPAPTVGEPAPVPGTISATDTEKSQTLQPSTTAANTTSNVIDMFANIPDKLEKLAAESINEADTIPRKSVVQGYQVDYNPRTRQVTVSRRGQVIGRGTNRLNSPKYHLTLINKIIDRAEEDKYPTDIDDRDVALPMRTATEGSVFGQQKFDTQMDLAKLKSQLTQPKSAQSAPAGTTEPQPVAYQPPARLSDLQIKKQRVDNLASIKQTIEQLQARATRGGRELPPGLAADLEDYFTTADIDTDYDEMMSKYQRQLTALQKYLNLRRAVWAPKKDVQEMKAKELEEARSETWTAYFTDGTKATISNVTDETDPARVRAFLAKKGKTVAKFDYGFGTMSDTVSKPEPHEPGSGSARSARTGEALPEDAVDRSGQKMYQAKEVYMLTHNGQEVAFYTLKDLKRAEQDAQDMQRKLGGEVHLRKVMREGEGSWKKETPWTKTTGKDPRGKVTHMSDVARRETEKLAQDSNPLSQLFKDFGKDFEKMYGSEPPVKEGEVVNINRGGFNAFRDKNDWLDKRDYVQRQLLDPRQRDNLPELKQRLLDINSAGRKLGYTT